MPDTNMLNGISLNTANNISVINLYLFILVSILIPAS